MLFPLSVSQHLHEIECNDSVLIFNTVLNNPIIISHEDMLWIHQHPYITFDFYSTLEPDYQESIGVLVGSFVYLENGINEYDLCKSINDSYLKQFICGKTFQYLDLRISEVCNFGCPHCIASSADHGKMMTVEEGRRFIDQYVAFKKEAEPSFKDLNIHFGNREPLLNFCVIQELIDYIKEQYKEYNVDLSVNTNLSLLTEQMASYLTSNQVAIYTSLDGPQEGNDLIRIYKSGVGTYKVIRTKMALLEKIGYPIKGISVTINEKNYPFINDAFVNWCINMGFSSVAYDFDLIHATNIPNEEKADFLASHWRKYQTVGIEFYGTFMTPFLNLCNECGAERSLSFCKAVKGLNLSVDCVGSVYACSYSSKPIANINNLKSAIQENGSYYALVSRHLSGQVCYETCKGCILEGSCIGMCEMTRECSTEHEIDQQCDYYRKVTVKLLRTQAEMMDED